MAATETVIRHDGDELPAMSCTSTGGWPHLQTANDELGLPDHAADRSGVPVPN